MTFDPTLAAVRFGTGLSPRFTRPVGVESILSDLSGPDEMREAIAIAGFNDAKPSHATVTWMDRAAKAALDTPDEAVAMQARDLVRGQVRVVRRQHHLATIGRALDAPLGLRERLVAFWADHFTVVRRPFQTAHLVTSFVEDAIRPHVTGSFAAMLRGVVTHPMMLIYLQQTRSTGPDSPVGQQRNLGLNENLARELLELHLLGVDGQYTQADVRELAELLTGLSYTDRRGFFYDPNRAEPGGETVVGLPFGADATLDNVLEAMDILAILPGTAEHLAWKMAVHFVSDDPDDDLVAAMAEGFGADGDLMGMTAAMLRHPAAWTPQRDKVRTPQQFITAGLRALGVTGNAVMAIDQKLYQQMLTRPLSLMGQPWETPIGPDGWPEDAESWIIPQGMAGRISWAMQLPRRIVTELPDPRDFVDHALGSLAGEDVRFAAAAAENRAEGVGVVLASAAFQRR